MEKFLEKEDRLSKELEIFRENSEPLPGTSLGKLLGVSRQVIVQDIALLRAKGYNITSTSKGYVYTETTKSFRVFKVCHEADRAMEELQLIIDYGGVVEDVRINHRVYGKMSAPLKIRNKKDILKFIHDIKTGKSAPLSNITSGYHFHKVTADDEQTLDEIEEQLRKEGFLAQLLPYEASDKELTD